MNQMEHSAGVDTPRQTHESDVVAIRHVTFAAVGLALGVVVIAVLMFGLIDWFEARSAPRQPERERDVSLPTIVQAWANPGQQLAEARAAGRARLDTYEWIDRERGVVRIPIERAMQLIVQQQTNEGTQP